MNSGLPIGLVIALVAAAIVVVGAGFLLWQYMFSNENSFDAGEKFKTPAKPEPTGEAEAVDIEPAQSLNPKTVSSADTISNKSDDDVVELKKRPFSSQQTVENAGDVSISMDDEE